MTKARMFFILGVWVAILPFLGFPYSWKDVLGTLTGLGLIFLSYLLYRDYKDEERVEIFDNFKENGDGEME